MPSTHVAVGGSGTLAYTPPEALCPSPTTGHYPPPDRATDMWALGLVLHLLVFFALPFAEAGPDGDTKKLEEEIKLYRGSVLDLLICLQTPIRSQCTSYAGSRRRIRSRVLPRPDTTSRHRCFSSSPS